MKKLPKWGLIGFSIMLVLILFVSRTQPGKYLNPRSIKFVVVNESDASISEPYGTQIVSNLAKLRIFSISCPVVDTNLSKTEFKCSKINWNSLRDLTIFIQREESIANIEDNNGRFFQMAKNGRLISMGRSVSLPSFQLSSKIELGDTILNEDLLNMLGLLSILNSPDIPTVEIVGMHTARFQFSGLDLYLRTDQDPELIYSILATSKGYYRTRGQNISKLDLRFADPVVTLVIPTSPYSLTQPK